MRYGPVWLLLLLSFFWFSGSAAGSQRAEAGRKLAVQHCGRCHVIPDHNPMGGIGSTPSFRLLLSMDDGMVRFESFFARRPHPSFIRLAGIDPPTKLPAAAEAVELSRSDFDDLMAYLRLLKKMNSQ
jgi:mono/diheme cytochrome c family protein